jgi:hypothetical protein
MQLLRSMWPRASLPDTPAKKPHAKPKNSAKNQFCSAQGLLLGLWVEKNANAYKAHVQCELLKAVPVKFQLTDGKANEKAVLGQNLEADRFYVLDRGYAKYGLLQQIIEAQSHFVCRISDVASFEVLEVKKPR